MAISHIDAVQDFMRATGQYDPVALFDHTNITDADLATIKLRLSLITEEVLELFQAVLEPDSFSCTEVETLFGCIQKQIEMVELEDLEFDRVEVADAITDIDYINTGSAVAFNIPLEECFEAVHSNNMTKVDPVTGFVTRSPSGKILKPSGYIPVSLTAILNK